MTTIIAFFFLPMGPDNGGSGGGAGGVYIPTFRSRRGR